MNDKVTTPLNSEYWRNEIIQTQYKLSELTNGDTAGVKSTKTNSNNISLQEIDKTVKALKSYLGYCESELEKALKRENGQKEEKYILYFNREYGY